MCQLLEEIPNNPEVLNFCGYTFVDQNVRLNEGLKLIEKAVEIDPENGFYIDSLGWANYRVGNINNAILYLERAVELEPNEVEISDHLGDAYWANGRKKEAILLWKRSLFLEGPSSLKEKIKKKMLENKIKYD